MVWTINAGSQCSVINKNKCDNFVRSTVLIKKMTSHVCVRMWSGMYSVWDHQMFNVCECVRERERERKVFGILYREEWLHLNHRVSVIRESHLLHVLCVIICNGESITESLKEFCDRMTFERMWHILTHCPIPPFLMSSFMFLHSLSPADSFACKGLSRIERDYASFFQEDFSVLCYGIPFMLFLSLYRHIWVS